MVDAFLGEAEEFAVDVDGQRPLRLNDGPVTAALADGGVIAGEATAKQRPDQTG